MRFMRIPPGFTELIAVRIAEVLFVGVSWVPRTWTLIQYAFGAPVLS
jgi:hypothetical protein